MMEQAENEREEEIRQWWFERTGRKPRKITARMEEEYEFAEAMAYAMSKDD